ncbi:DUF3718 domain-containing protein [Rheinheimera sp.]|uniref:DUF3718 domain-containing protein n=1 Tax=Rheinheimera sp. TaxID=1869214 RepID=UPI003AF769ED
MKVLASIAILAAVISGSTQASDTSYSMDPSIEQLLVKVCSQSQDDDKFGLNKTLKANRLSKQNAVDKVVCNGQPLVTFARSYEAHKVVKMLERYEQRSKGKVSISDVVAAPN